MNVVLITYSCFIKHSEIKLCFVFTHCQQLNNACDAILFKLLSLNPHVITFCSTFLQKHLAQSQFKKSWLLDTLNNDSLDGLYCQLPIPNSHPNPALGNFMDLWIQYHKVSQRYDSYLRNSLYSQKHPLTPEKLNLSPC